MAGRGRRFTFHGSFKSKSKAVAKEQTIGGFIRKVCFGSECRYTVMKPRKKR